jgi:GLPGLI family protein
MIRTIAGCLICLLIATGCSKKDRDSRITQGRIEYHITYETDSAHRKLVDLLPHRMKLIFDQDSAINVMEGFMGLYKLNSITYFRSKRCITLLKVPKYTFLFTGKKGEPMCCFDPLDNMIVDRTDETKEILGFKCRKANISFPDNDYTYSVYYTNEFNIRNPNSTNPYKKIEGVLMEFELNMYYFRLHFTADKFLPVPKNDTHFSIPKDYKELTRDQMCRLLGRYLE